MIYKIVNTNSGEYPTIPRDRLGNAIVNLAKQEREEVHFRDHKFPQFGTIILLECSPTFLKKVEKLPGFHTAQEYEGADTERNLRIQQCFASFVEGSNRFASRSYPDQVFPRPSPQP